MSRPPQIQSRYAPDVRRAQILTAARRAFARNEYAGVSMAGVGRDAGVTPGLVNHYFGTKRDLYLAVVSDAAATISSVVRTDLGELSLRERVDRNLDEFFDSIQRERESWALLFGARTRRDPAVAKLVAVVRAETVDRMARNNAGEPGVSADLELELRIFLGAAESGIAEWVSGRAKRERVHKVLSELLLGLLEDRAEPG